MSLPGPREGCRYQTSVVPSWLLWLDSIPQRECHGLCLAQYPPKSKEVTVSIRAISGGICSRNSASPVALNRA